MPTLESRLISLAMAIGNDIKTARQERGDLSALSTTARNSLVAAINELFAMTASAGAQINDAAGDGDTAVTWSANRIYDAIEAAKLAVRNELTDGASAALDTLSELAAALNNDPNFSATIATELANRVRYDAVQTLSAPQQAQARTNIGAMSSAAIGDPDRDLVSDYTTAKT